MKPRIPTKLRYYNEPIKVRHTLPLPVEAVLRSVCREHEVGANDVARGSKKPEHVRARYDWIVLVRNTWALSAAETGRLLNLDHTTVLDACRRVEERRAS